MNPPSNDSQQVLDIVRRWAAAELAGDVDAYDHLLTADFTGVTPQSSRPSSGKQPLRGDATPAARSGWAWSPSARVRTGGSPTSSSAARSSNRARCHHSPAESQSR